MQTDMAGVRNPVEMSVNREGELYFIKPGDKAVQACPETRNRPSNTTENMST